MRFMPLLFSRCSFIWTLHRKELNALTSFLSSTKERHMVTAYTTETVCLKIYIDSSSFVNEERHDPIGR